MKILTKDLIAARAENKRKDEVIANAIDREARVLCEMCSEGERVYWEEATAYHLLGPESLRRLEPCFARAVRNVERALLQSEKGE